ncbi:hypothetical protein [Rhizobium esperanzae]|uniref:Uncharacterized protein n=1 Tax=Rhizobium esperanzae TaxID=1967781 RepID=A0A7W6R8T0_9HYPH|nr:hypothetical protein [Rhizobium esperanzae]MBB4238938.1 hypothetical protein [Rhizobium esperanzae]
MTYRTIYSDVDFAEMGWHDATVYSITFPQANFTISFDIDYIFKWHRTQTELRGWDVAPCTLEFQNISDLKMSLDWQMQGDTTILDITRQNRQLSPNGKFVCWDYRVELDVGVVSFTATGFEQVVRTPSIFSESQSLGRKNRVLE